MTTHRPQHHRTECRGPSCINPSSVSLLKRIILRSDCAPKLSTQYSVNHPISNATRLKSAFLRNTSTKMTEKTKTKPDAPTKIRYVSTLAVCPEHGQERKTQKSSHFRQRQNQNVPRRRTSLTNNTRKPMLRKAQVPSSDRADDSVECDKERCISPSPKNIRHFIKQIISMS